MKLYIFPFAPNVMRVQIVMREKGVSAEVVDASVDRVGYTAINPLQQAPTLVLDDGTVLTESLTIAHYIDGASGPPFLFGDTDQARLQIEMWERRAEMGLFNPAVEYGHHINPMFAQWMPQFPDYAATIVPKVERMADLFALQLDQFEFIAADRFTAADITALLGWFNLIAYGAVKAERWPSISRWANRLLSRDSLEPVRSAVAAFNVAV